MIGNQLFQGEKVFFAGHDPEKDAVIESAWMHDSEYLTLVSAVAVYPFSPAQIKKKYEEVAKEKNPFRFSFAVRAIADERLLGFVRLEHFEWANQAGNVAVGIGNAADRGQGYGTETLRLFLHYAFAELNFRRIGATCGAYNAGAIKLLENAGFKLEVRRREGLHRFGKYWDDLTYGLLRREWELKQ